MESKNRYVNSIVFPSLIPWKMYRYQNNEAIYLFYFVSIAARNNAKLLAYPYDLIGYDVFTLYRVCFPMSRIEIENLLLIETSIPDLCKNEEYIFAFEDE